MSWRSRKNRGHECRHWDGRSGRQPPCTAQFAHLHSQRRFYAQRPRRVGKTLARRSGWRGFERSQARRKLNCRNDLRTTTPRSEACSGTTPHYAAITPLLRLHYGTTARSDYYTLALSYARTLTRSLCLPGFSKSRGPAQGTRPPRGGDCTSPVCRTEHCSVLPFGLPKWQTSDGCP